STPHETSWHVTPVPSDDPRCFLSDNGRARRDWTAVSTLGGFSRCRCPYPGCAPAGSGTPSRGRDREFLRGTLGARDDALRRLRRYLDNCRSDPTDPPH